ncbi:MAG: double zinc ribbon domain-containing protein [bacterium]
MFSSFFDKTKKAADFSLDILFPKNCLSCHREGFYVCPECFAKIPVQKSFYCYICGRRSPEGKTCHSCKLKTGSALSGLLVASNWNNLLIRQMIYECKYRFIKDLGALLGDLLILFLNQSGFFRQYAFSNPEFFLLVPVPLHRRRSVWRGFNQTELIAVQLNKHLKIPAAKHLLKRTRHTPPQMDIADKLARIQNVKNAFQLDPDLKTSEITDIKNKIVILIDDVCTTGSTLEQCAQALKPLKPKEIWGLVVARG